MKGSFFRSLRGLICAIFLAASFSAAVPVKAINIICWRDDFSGSLDPAWTWVREVPGWWSLSYRMGGYLTIWSEQNYTVVDNILLRSVPFGDFIIETHVFFKPLYDYQFAGLIFYQDDDNYLQIGRGYNDNPGLGGIGDAVYFNRIENGSAVEGNFAHSTTAVDEIYLKVWRFKGSYYGFYSENGMDWIHIGTHQATISPTGMGLKVSNQAQGVFINHADFNYVSMADNTFYYYLPVVRK